MHAHKRTTSFKFRPVAINFEKVRKGDEMGAVLFKSARDGPPGFIRMGAYIFIDSVTFVFSCNDSVVACNCFFLAFSKSNKALSLHEIWSFE